MQTLKQRTLELVAACHKAQVSGKSIVITGHDCPDADSVISCIMLQELLSRAGIDADIKLATPPDSVTLRDMRELGVWSDSLVCALEPDEVLVLVDHHKSFYKNDVIACVDHHTTPPEPTCEAAIVLRASSCGKVIYDMMLACEIAHDEAELLALYSVYLDTQSCKSSKFNAEDREWVEHCIQKYALDRIELERMGYCLNSPETPVDELCMFAYKKYEFGGKVSASTAIQIDERDESWQTVIDSMVSRLVRMCKEQGTELWVLVVNKPEIGCSDLCFIYRDGRVDVKKLSRLASRTRDVIPVVSAL